MFLNRVHLDVSCWTCFWEFYAFYHFGSFVFLSRICYCWKEMGSGVFWGSGFRDVSPRKWSRGRALSQGDRHTVALWHKLPGTVKSMSFYSGPQASKRTMCLLCSLEHNLIWRQYQVFSAWGCVSAIPFCAEEKGLEVTRCFSPVGPSHRLGWVRYFWRQVLPLPHLS